MNRVAVGTWPDLGIKTLLGDTLYRFRPYSPSSLPTGLSTVEVAFQNVGKLNKEFKNFYQKKNFKYMSLCNETRDPDKIDSPYKTTLNPMKIKYGLGQGRVPVKGYLYNSAKVGDI